PSVPRIAPVGPMFFFDRCQSKYAWALSAGLRLHSVEGPDRLTGQFIASDCPAPPGRHFPQGRLRRVRAGSPVHGRFGGVGSPLLVQCRLHIRDTWENYVRRTRRSIDRARSRRTASARRVRGCTVVVRNAAQACLTRREKRGDIERIEQGTFLAKHSVRRSGMRNAGENDRWREDR
ncbi:hypothetical protein, partial [Burkholderia cenocepacia]|uniref:hypothetical protein n=1 Tax=Burkholderia cenocepacia TaxID=95486 RepID=UPI001E3DD0FC